MEEKINLRESMAKMKEIHRKSEGIGLPEEYYTFNILMKEALNVGTELHMNTSNLEDAKNKLVYYENQKNRCNEKIDIIEKEINRLITSEQLDELFKQLGGQVK